MKDLVIQNQSGQDVTTSLIVAEVFGKNHRDVLRDIERLSCSMEFRERNFAHTPYVHPQNGQVYHYYEMTKDGFSFLVMGYTGAKAGEFKERFINEFNKRDMLLKNDDYILARSQEILKNRLQAMSQQLQIAQGTIESQQEQIRALAPKASYTDEVLQSTSTYTLTQVAHDLGMRSVHVLLRELCERRVLFRQSGQWQPTAKVAGRGYFETRTAKYVKSDNTVGTSLSTVVTERGRAYLHSMFNNSKN